MDRSGRIRRFLEEETPTLGVVWVWAEGFVERIPGFLAKVASGRSCHFLSLKDKEWAGACSSELGRERGWKQLDIQVAECRGEPSGRHLVGTPGDSTISPGEREQSGEKGHDRVRRPSSLPIPTSYRQAMARRNR